MLLYGVELFVFLHLRSRQYTLHNRYNKIDNNYYYYCEINPQVSVSSVVEYVDKVR